MLRKEIIEYIEKELKKGFHISMIKQALSEVGHDMHDIEEAVEHIHKRHAHKRVGIIIVAVLILIVGSYFIITTTFNINEYADDGRGELMIPPTTSTSIPAESGLGAGNTEISPEQKNFNEILMNAVVNKDIKECDKLTGDYKEECIFVVNQQPDVDSGSGQASTNSDSIDEIQSQSESDNNPASDNTNLDDSSAEGDEMQTDSVTGSDREIFFRAVSEKNVAICNEIVNSALKEECVFVVSQG